MLVNMSRTDEIAETAWRLVAEGGPDALTMRAVAARMGIQAPSLYKHVSGRDEIVAMVQARALVEMADALVRAGRGKRGSARRVAMALAYRGYATSHPGHYRVATGEPLLRSFLPPGLEEEALAPVLAIADGDRTRARILWATAHGLVSLELARRFPDGADLDAVWRSAFADR